MKVTIDISQASEELKKDLATVTGPQAQRELNEFMAVREKTRDYLAGLAETRHDTANRLGATPSGHLAQAARAVEDAPVSTDAESGSFVINHPGMVRAFRDVTIVPRAAKALAIPLNAEAYNRRPRQFGPDAFFVFRSKTTGNAFLAKRQKEKGEKPLLMYLLVKSVHQPQDRTLLPSDAEWAAAAVEAADEWFNKKIEALT